MGENTDNNQTRSKQFELNYFKPQLPPSSSTLGGKIEKKHVVFSNIANNKIVETF